MKVWIYLDNRQQGPFELEDLVNKSGLTPDTLAWYEGLPKWQRIADLPQVYATIFDNQRENIATHIEVSDSEAFNQSQAPGDAVAAEAREEAAVSEAIATEESAAQQNNGNVHFNPGVYNATTNTEPTEPCPPSYIGWSVFSLICCCSPISLAALIASLYVSTSYSRGDITNAKKASEWAAWLIMIAIALGFIPVAIMSLYLD